jgi:hypothetical protein
VAGAADFGDWTTKQIEVADENVAGQYSNNISPIFKQYFANIQTIFRQDSVQVPAVVAGSRLEPTTAVAIYGSTRCIAIPTLYSQ